MPPKDPRRREFGTPEEAAALTVECNCGAAVGEPCDWRSGHCWKTLPKQIEAAEGERP